ncbi:MAG TPA: Hsp20/alpha crystallin family protein [Flavobacteriaceae bacterium]|nr:Hsp20/alpha crystallin family protein [Flavobacteriaceae bacterium]
MNIMRRNHWLPSVLDEMFNGDWIETNNPIYNFNKNIPATNVKETNDEFILEIAAPGLKKEDFEIELDENVLTISSENKTTEETEEKNYTIREFGYDSFKRSFTLPKSIDNSKISADYADGVLKIDLPKREEAKVQPKRLIEIA